MIALHAIASIRLSSEEVRMLAIIYLCYLINRIIPPLEADEQECSNVKNIYSYSHPVNQTTELSKNKQTTISPLIYYTPNTAKSCSGRQNFQSANSCPVDEVFTYASLQGIILSKMRKGLIS
jgi:hypothetical protein